MDRKLDGKLLSDMVVGSATLLDKNKEYLNALNVFPVPDGDTGTNMSLTMLAAAREVSCADKNDFVAVVNALSMGALKGARGNSGVILSQIFRGFCDILLAEKDMVTENTLAKAVTNGVDCAYKAIMKPKEGTILTVAKAMAESAKRSAAARLSFNDMLDRMISDSEDVLRKTPDMLPVLKEAGVVDAGGAGLVVVLKGFLMVLCGDDFEVLEDLSNIADNKVSDSINENIEFGYCTEFFIKNLYGHVSERDIEAFRISISRIGDCVIVVGDLNLVKVHVHTNDPGIVLQTALTLGMLSCIKIDNMREQHRELSSVNIDSDNDMASDKKDMAVIAVVSGEGLRESFANCGVDVFVEGGQTMNPSADDILKAINTAPSDNVIILPNNKNIIMAAEQAAELSSKKIVVIKSKTIPQGFSALFNYNSTDSFDENREHMEAALNLVKTGQVTYAVRDTSVNGMSIKEGQKIGIGEGEILAKGSDVNAVSVELLEKLCDDDTSVIGIYYGEDISKSTAESLQAELSARYDCCDIELSYGGQAVYSYIFSVE